MVRYLNLNKVINQRLLNNMRQKMRWGLEKRISFKNRLYKISYEPENKKDIPKTGVKYKPKIRGKV